MATVAALLKKNPHCSNRHRVYNMKGVFFMPDPIVMVTDQWHLASEK